MKNIITNILVELESDIQKLVAAYAVAHEKHSKTPMTQYQLEYTEIMVTYDFIKSVEQYTSKDDVLVSVQSSVSKKGNLEISVRISRDTQEYSLATEVIYAGGHNIQRLHYRYITHTNLPKTGNKTMSDEYATKIKKMTKIEKLEEEIKINRNWMARYQGTVDKLSALTTPDEIFEYVCAEHPYSYYATENYWDNMREDAQEWYGSQEAFEVKKEEELKKDIASFHHSLKRAKNEVVRIQKDIAKLEAKIAAL